MGKPAQGCLTKCEAIRTVLEKQKPPYVPWSCGFTVEAKLSTQKTLPFGSVDDVR